jgi:hypothetical protein
MTCAENLDTTAREASWLTIVFNGVKENHIEQHLPVALPSADANVFFYYTTIHSRHIIVVQLDL